jgi:hypothetical protein
MKITSPNHFSIIFISLFLLLVPGLIKGQQVTGRVISSETGSGIAYVNVGIIGRNAGTVTDEKGNFTLSIDREFDNDSLRFFMIGFGPRAVLVTQFRNDPSKIISLHPVIYQLGEVNISSRRARKTEIGDEVVPNDFRSGFAYNTLGSELGHKVYTRHPIKLQDINLNIGVCTYDSVTYRLNIYRKSESGDYKNILTVPIYISFTKEQINDPVTIDLSKYSIVIEGDIIIALELYKDLGEGRLLFRTRFLQGSTIHRKASEAEWTEAAGSVGMYLHGLVLR